MSGNLRWMGRLDMYRKVPTDLLEGTKRGSILSLMASFVMLSLFLLETGAFFTKRYALAA
jgi:Endoplasmic Reticulum-Golgi Intermediate Compartment (ERGIC)